MQKWHDCIALANQVIESIPDDVKSLYRRSLCKKEIGDYYGAIEDLKIALEFAERNND